MKRDGVAPEVAYYVANAIDAYDNGNSEEDFCEYVVAHGPEIARLLFCVARSSSPPGCGPGERGAAARTKPSGPLHAGSRRACDGAPLGLLQLSPANLLVTASGAWDAACVGALLNLLAFPIPLDVRSEVLGTRAWIRVKQYRAQLCFPRLGPNSDPPFAELEAPRVKGASFLLLVDEVSYDQDQRDKVRWGAPWLWDKDQVQIASVAHAILRLPVDGPLAERIAARTGERILGSFPDWFELFQAWVEVLSGQDLDSRHPIRWTRTESVALTHAWVADEGSPRPYSFVNPPPQLVTRSPENALTRKQLRLAIKAADSSISLPPEPLLIRDARAAFHRGKYREAVLEAATAVEYVVTVQLKQRLSRVHSRPVVRELLRQNRNVSARIALARKLGTKLPDDLYDSVIKPRNEALHEKVHITRDRARTALDIATAVVSKHVPLARLGAC